MNLITDKWIPVQRADGSIEKVAPYEIGDTDNPIIRIFVARPDFRGALNQFLIALVQTAFPPQDEFEWIKYWESLPGKECLSNAFNKFNVAFELYSESGPSFMQEYSPLDTPNDVDIRSLFIDSPFSHTIELNQDLFNKRDRIVCICDSCAAIALYTLQINSPSGGKGHRTGIRGGGPLTTLVIPEESDLPLWKTIWLNILNREDAFSESSSDVTKRIFPWLAETQTSEGNIQVAPEDVDQLQMFWSMPRRIRLSLNTRKDSQCSICGVHDKCWSSYKTLPYGIKYSDTWVHAHSPYRKKENKNGMTILALKGKQGGYFYPDWISLILGADMNTTAALSVRAFFSKKYFEIGEQFPVRLWSFGYDMDNMKARCWYDQFFPIFHVSPLTRAIFVQEAIKASEAAEECAQLYFYALRDAWFSDPKSVPGDLRFYKSAFFEYTELCFYQTMNQLLLAIEKGEPVTKILSDWRDAIIKAAKYLFEKFALRETEIIPNLKRISFASFKLHNIITSKKNKKLWALKES